MAGELAYDPATGQLVYSPATGQLALDCAAAGGDPCGYCTGATPANLSVTLANVVNCGGVGSDPTDLNTVEVICAQDAGDACHYLGSQAAGGATWVYAITITSATTFRISVYVQGVPIEQCFCSLSGAFASGECTNINDVVDNDIATCGSSPPCLTGIASGAEGTATVVAA